MPIKYTLKLMPQAERDLEEIYEYIFYELKNYSAAANFMTEISDALIGLESMPKSCPFSGIEELRKDGYRKCVIKKYVALYTVDENQKFVKVAKVFYGMRDYKNLGLF